MICSAITERIEADYPREKGCEWDRKHLGLQVGDSKKEIHHVLVALDVTSEVIERAETIGADLIVAHHPLMFSGLYHASDEDFTGERVMKLLRAGINVYTMHTNYDAVSMARLGAKLIHMHSVEPLDEEEEIGVIGEIDEMGLDQLARRIKEAFRMTDVRVYGSGDRPVRRVALLPGSGKGSLSLALHKGADVLVTGDVDHHMGLDATEQGIGLIDGGHYGLEHIYVDHMAAYLAEHFPDLTITTDETGYPYHLICQET